MANHMSSADIAEVTHISQQTVQRVIAMWKKTRKVEQWPLVRRRPRELNSGDVAVYSSFYRPTTISHSILAVSREFGTTNIRFIFG